MQVTMQTEPNGTAKRKHPPASPAAMADRPIKQHRPEASSHAPNGLPLSPEHTEMHDDDEVTSECGVAVAGQDTAEWQRTIESVVKSVVSIHFCQTCSFDTDAAVSSEATGFVVDAEQGYILTNRVCTRFLVHTRSSNIS